MKLAMEEELNPERRRPQGIRRVVVVVPSFFTLANAACQNHFAHHRQTVFAKKHMFGATQPNSLCAINSRHTRIVSGIRI